ncbi:MAG: FecR domain-containing protein [Campylobacterales bacterium]
MSPLKIVTATLLAFAVSWASVGEITLLKGDAFVKRVVALPAPAAIETNTTAETNATETGELNATVPEEGNTSIGDVNLSAPVEATAAVPATQTQELNATVGMPLEEGDIVITRAKAAQVRIKMSDGTLITVGGGTEMKIEAFSTETNDASFDLAQGTLRTITGQIGKIAPDRFKIKTKTATMGIRGTDFITALGAEGALDAACLEGAISVTTDVGAVDVPAGSMTSATPGAAPSAPVALSAAVLGAFFGALGLDDDEAAGETERFVPPPAVQENNETNATITIPPVAGKLIGKAGAIKLTRAEELPGLSDDNLTLLEQDALVFVQAARIEFVRGVTLQAGKGGEMVFNAVDANISIAPAALKKGTFLIAGATRLNTEAGEVTLGENAKAILSIEGSAIHLASLEGEVTLKGQNIGNLLLTEGGEAQPYEAKKLISLFEAAGLNEADAKPYLPKPKALPKPKIYKF